MCLCLYPTIIKKHILKTRYSMITRPNKRKLCKLDFSYNNNLNKFRLEFGISDTSRIKNRTIVKNVACAPLICVRINSISVILDLIDNYRQDIITCAHDPDIRTYAYRRGVLICVHVCKYVSSVKLLTTTALEKLMLLFFFFFSALGLSHLTVVW